LIEQQDGSGKFYLTDFIYDIIICNVGDSENNGLCLLARKC
jgi:hypothetical protein